MLEDDTSLTSISREGGEENLLLTSGLTMRYLRKKLKGGAGLGTDLGLGAGERLRGTKDDDEE